MEEQPFEWLARGADLNPARVIAWEVWHDWGYLLSMIIKKGRLSLCIESDVLPAEINTALNQEGVVPFDQPYQFEVTTDPIGPHYITS
jgi:hypothetical protein